MAVTFIEERKRQKKLIGVLLIVVLITVIVLWQGFLKKPISPIGPIGPISPIGPIGEVKINFQVLENPILKKLQAFEKIKPFEEEIGRENPFIPYEITK